MSGRSTGSAILAVRVSYDGQTIVLRDYSEPNVYVLMKGDAAFRGPYIIPEIATQSVSYVEEPFGWTRHLKSYYDEIGMGSDAVYRFFNGSVMRYDFTSPIRVRTRQRSALRAAAPSSVR